MEKGKNCRIRGSKSAGEKEGKALTFQPHIKMFNEYSQNITHKTVVRNKEKKRTELTEKKERKRRWSFSEWIQRKRTRKTTSSVIQFPQRF